MKLLKIGATFAAGYIAGLLLARKPGKKLRAELKKSENPAKTMLTEMWEVKKDTWEEITEWAQNSKELQKALADGKEYFEEVVKKAKEYGEDAMEEAKENLEKFAEHAKSAAEELKGHERKKK